jgi:uncharacterized integral membrane protein
MSRIVATVILVVVLSVLVSMNLSFTTTVNLFGTKLESVSVVAVAALSFALGVVYSLIVLIGRSLRSRAKRGLASRDRHLAEREKELLRRETDAGRLTHGAKPVDAHEDGKRMNVKKDAAEENGDFANGGRSGLARFFDLFRTRS